MSRDRDSRDKGRDSRDKGRDSRDRGRESQSPFADQVFTVEGIAAVAEYARFRPAALTEVRAEKRAMAEVAALLKQHGVKAPLGERTASKDGGDAAPVAARVALAAVPPAELAGRLKDRPKDLIVAVDHITDPRNLGAVVRSAAFFGVREVIAPERRQVLLTQAAVHTAQGGFALCDLVCVVNLGRALADLKEQGYWIIGTAMDGEEIGKVASSKYDKVVLVLGSEDSGLSKGIRDNCDRLASIKGRGRGLESLNVSVAAGIALQEFARGLE